MIFVILLIITFIQGKCWCHNFSREFFFFFLPFKLLSVASCLHDLLGQEETEIKTISQATTIIHICEGLFHDGKTSAYGRKSVVFLGLLGTKPAPPSTPRALPSGHPRAHWPLDTVFPPEPRPPPGAVCNGPQIPNSWIPSSPPPGRGRINFYMDFRAQKKKKERKKENQSS